METSVPVIAASTQRQIGYVIAGIVLLAMAAYWLFNWLEGRKEGGAEIELAANRKPHMSDEDMETKRLDVSLTGGLITLTVIALALPLYWLGEPGRQTGLVEFVDDQSVRQGAELYEANCAECHGTVNGDGGVAAGYTLVDGNGVYKQQVDWVAPSLGAVLDRFSYDEVKYILEYGRQNSPMPAWGGPGGGPMTDLQIDKVIAYIASEQKHPEDITKGVDAGVAAAALFKARQDNPEVWAEQLALEDETDRVEDELAELDPESDDAAQVQSELDAVNASREAVQAELQTIADGFVEAAASDQVLYGELLFNNPAAGGAYGCARCHSAGYSFAANNYPTNPLIPPIENGGGGFGPTLIGVEDQFETAESQVAFVVTGSKNGVKYGAFGQGDGGGQMPGFLGCYAEDNAILPRIQTERITGHCAGTSQTALNANEGEVIPRPGILTEEQIAAIVAYERSLD